MERLPEWLSNGCVSHSSYYQSWHHGSNHGSERLEHRLQDSEVERNHVRNLPHQSGKKCCILIKPLQKRILNAGPNLLEQAGDLTDYSKREDHPNLLDKNLCHPHRIPRKCVPP